MVSTTLQVSLRLSEVNVLEAESNRQVAIALRERQAAIDKGEKGAKLKAIGPSTVAAQIIRAALPEVEKRPPDEKKGVKK